MNHDIKYILFYSILVSSVFILVELTYRVFRVEAEFTRKTAHVICGLITLSYPNVFDHQLPVLILNIQSLLLLVLSRLFGFMPSINNIPRKSWGSFWFPVSVYVVFVISLYFENKSFYYIPILILSISDPFAGISGMLNKSNFKKSGTVKNKAGKTLLGSSLFAFSALTISLIMTSIYFDFSFFKFIAMSIVITIFSTIVERYSNKGIDNLTIPLSVLLILIIFNI